MLGILIPIVLILFFSIIGLFLCKLVRVDDEVLYSGGFAAGIPIIGAIATTCILQLLNSFIPVKFISILIILIFVFAIFYLRKSLGSFYKAFFSNKALLIIVVLGVILLNLPCIINNELLSLQNPNNDIAYYLSSMDWLQDHRFTQAITFNQQAPFPSLANFMVTVTRFGADLLGSFCMTVFFLQPHQIFLTLSVLFSAFCIMAVYSCGVYALKMPKLAALFSCAIIASGTTLFALIVWDYAPQIFGIACMIMFIAMTVRLFNERHKGLIFLTALFIVGTVTVYAEFSAYLFIMYIISGACYFVLNIHSKDKTKTLICAVKAGILSFILNPIGIYIALKFNLMILKTGLSNNDPLSGKIMDADKLLYHSLGLSSVESVKSMLINRFKYHTDFILNIYVTGITVALIICAIFICIGIVLKKDRLKYTVLGIIAFFMAYWAYFRHVKYAYGEFKHVTSISIIIVLFAVYFIDGVKLKGFLKPAKTSVFALIAFCLIGYNAYRVQSEYRFSNHFHFDHSVAELAEGAEIIPKGEVLSVESGSYAFVHSVAYSLRNSDVPIQLTSKSTSYLNYFIDYTPYRTKYFVADINSKNFFDVNEDVVWKNAKYKILKSNDDFVGNITDGFQTLEAEPSGTLFRWTSAQESKMYVNNISGKEKSYVLSFDTNVGDFGAKHIDVYLGDTKIVSGITGQTIVCAPITLDADKNAEIKIVTSEPLNTLPDGRSVGFKMSNVKVE